MTTTYVSRYDRRVKLVQNTLAAHAELGDTAAKDLAVHVLQALDHIPEEVRR
ncbi:hypothetical protein EV193_111167 [Herbihabitans rhizosphaerae]|uniref:Uncharacterized protein n=1 Tax=Herbihabitans rhizosphaerae TaxID=1872711 RepID=A0A4Q7KFX0_9PSEU|nr:DUF6307 family protein [Herbihabitans rhizosphaerae]RZS32782.1 hypothetical protein EV193_111167 [Herbihabitans rhizosphaerae]